MLADLRVVEPVSWVCVRPLAKRRPAEGQIKLALVVLCSSYSEVNRPAWRKESECGAIVW
jgi:hypothetical protein